MSDEKKLTKVEVGQTRLADRARAEIDGAEARLLAALPAGGSTNASGSYIQGHPGPSEEKSFCDGCCHHGNDCDGTLDDDGRCSEWAEEETE
jgi:hypothetical protein